MKVRLHFAEKLRIVDWLRANKEDLMRRQDDYEVVAERAGRELNLNVTFCGLRGILKDMGMLWFRTGQRGLGKKTIERQEAQEAAGPIEPVKPIEPTAPIAKQGELFLDAEGVVVESNGVQAQIDGLRNRVTTIGSRVQNAPDLDDLVAAIKRLSEVVQAVDGRVGDIENALTKPETKV